MSIAGSGIPPAIKLAIGEDAVYWDGSDKAREDVKRLGHATKAAGTVGKKGDLDIEVGGGRHEVLPVGGWLIRRQGGAYEVYKV